MSTAPMTSAHAMALPSPVVWRRACCPVGSPSTFQPKIATQREQMVPPPLATGLVGYGPTHSSPALGQTRPCGHPEVHSSGQVTSICGGVTQGHSCRDREWHRRGCPQGGHLCASLAAASSTAGLHAFP